jgi:hypothetical protein
VRVNSLKKQLKQHIDKRKVRFKQIKFLFISSTNYLCK